MFKFAEEEILGVVFVNGFLEKLAEEGEDTPKLRAAYDALKKGRRSRMWGHAGKGSLIGAGLGAVGSLRAASETRSPGLIPVGALIGALAGANLGGPIGYVRGSDTSTKRRIRDKYGPELARIAERADTKAGRAGGIGALAGTVLGGNTAVGGLIGGLIGRGSADDAMDEAEYRLARNRK